MVSDIKRLGDASRLNSVPILGWLGLILTAAGIFAGCTALVRTVEFAGLPQNDGDRWELATAFSGTVSAAFIAAAVAWVAGRSAERTRLATGANTGEPASPDRNPVATVRFTRAFRGAALTVGVMANIAITASTVAKVAQGTWLFGVAIMSVAVGVVSLYLAYIGGALLRAKQIKSGVASVGGWLTAGIGLTIIDIVAIPGGTLRSSTRLEFPPETLLLTIVFLITGLAVMIDPKFGRQNPHQD